ncbi:MULTISPECIES: hypothetical protein [unclassified Embleya]|uniref:hypothetical protein n=1 Tax=unclassified Embleya TaxID=2699296 RepID=UPI0033FC6D02
MSARHRAPARRPPGSEAAHPRSDLAARRVMSTIALPFFVIGCALCALAATADVTHGVRTLWIVAAIVCAATAVIAWIDLRVIARRMRAERTGSSRAR